MQEGPFTYYICPMAVANNYDNIAAIYDPLSLLIFGRSLRRAQAFMLNVLTPGQRVLVVGGGAGWILEAMAARLPDGLHITYVELSAKMTALARKRNIGGHDVDFIRGSITAQSWPAGYFDVVFTAFFFDNFQQEAAEHIFAQLHQYLKTGGYWLFADFEVEQGQRYWQQPLLNGMYFFFRMVSHIDARQLQDMAALFQAHGYTPLQQKRFYSRFVQSVIYRKGQA
ncbi:Methyltransferase domain-containing protein [Chitinophaga costaii]|uniref:Methyltransferase domain-containing protein n=2 Tax=Chitinophaga costaii TaxID=1335309 RepID=A0A1C4FNC0_9BACT|nr:Methyltransferase domain-containing protein [Chitinophaga costaii]